MNIYSVLDDSDNEEVTKKQEKKTPAPAAAKKTDAPAAKATNAAKPADTKAPAPKSKSEGNGASKPKENKAPKDKAAAPVAGDAEVVAQKDDNRGGKPRGKDHKKAGKPKEEGEQPRRPKREFERRSGTGRGRELAKGGRGAFGFGNVNQEAQEGEKDPNAAEVAVEAVDGATTEEAAAPVEPEPEAEPEPATFTYEEYLARKAAGSSTVGGVKKERTVDKAVFSALTAKKDDVSDFIEGKTVNKSLVDSHKDQRSSGKNQLDIVFKFVENARPEREERGDRPRTGGRFSNDRGSGRGRGGDRGERGGDRDSGRGRGSGRGPRPNGNGSAFKASDADFPAL